MALSKPTGGPRVVNPVPRPTIVTTKGTKPTIYVKNPQLLGINPAKMSTSPIVVRPSMMVTSLAQRVTPNVNAIKVSGMKGGVVTLGNPSMPKIVAAMGNYQPGHQVQTSVLKKPQPTVVSLATPATMTRVTGISLANTTTTSMNVQATGQVQDVTSPAPMTRATGITLANTTATSMNVQAPGPSAQQFDTISAGMTRVTEISLANTPAISGNVQATGQVQLPVQQTATTQSIKDPLAVIGDNPESQIVLELPDNSTVTFNQESITKPFSGKYSNLIKCDLAVKVERVREKCVIADRGRLCAVDGITYHNQEGLILLDCPICQRPKGLTVLASHLMVDHLANDIMCPANNCGFVQCEDLYSHIVKRHFCFKCSRCRQVTNVYDCIGHMSSKCVKVSGCAEGKIMYVARELSVKDLKGTLDDTENEVIEKEKHLETYCNFCHRDVEEDLKTHLIENHEQKITCAFCLHSYPKSKYPLHLNFHLKEKKSKRERRKTCFICQKSVLGLKSHLRSDHEMLEEDANSAYEAFFEGKGHNGKVHVYKSKMKGIFK